METKECILFSGGARGAKAAFGASAERLGLAAEQVLSNIDRYANTTGGTIPLAICDAVDGDMLEPGDNVLLAAFGAGFTWGGIYIKWGHAV